MNIIAKLWGRLFGPSPVVVPAQVPVPVKQGNRKAGLWAKAYGALAGDGDTPEHTPLSIPSRLPGVIPEVLPTVETGLVLAMDAAGPEYPCMATDNSPFAWGSQANAIGPGLQFLGFPYLAEMNQITEYRTPAEVLSTEMTRRWGKIRNKGKEKKDDVIHDVTERLEQLKIRDLFREVALKTEEFGRSHLSVNVRGQGDDATRQLPLTEIKKGDLLGFTCIEPYWLTPYSWNSMDPTRSDFYKPQSWFVLGKKTHHTRLLTFIFREVPDLLKPAYDFAGISMTQLMMPYVNRWLRTAKSVNDLINIFSIVNLETDLFALLQDPVEFVKRLQTFTQTRDNRGVMATNKDTEALTMQNVPLGTLDKLQAQAQEHMATPGRLPLIKFFGIVPSGLSATSDGEFQNFYDYVAAMQELGYSPHMEKVLQFVQMDLYGKVDPDLVWEWASLFEPTPQEFAAIRKSDSERDGMYMDKGVITNQEVRAKLQNDPESGYDNLDGDAPDPPEVVEAGMQEESAENAHGRSEESAEAAHGRAKELAKVKPPGATGK